MNRFTIGTGLGLCLAFVISLPFDAARADAPSEWDAMLKKLANSCHFLDDLKSLPVEDLALEPRAILATTKIYGICGAVDHVGAAKLLNSAPRDSYNGLTALAMGHYHYTGIGVPQDTEMGRRFLRDAAFSLSATPAAFTDLLPLIDLSPEETDYLYNQVDEFTTFFENQPPDQRRARLMKIGIPPEASQYEGTIEFNLDMHAHEKKDGAAFIELYKIYAQRGEPNAALYLDRAVRTNYVPAYLIQAQTHLANASSKYDYYAARVLLRRAQLAGYPIDETDLRRAEENLDQTLLKLSEEEVLNSPEAQPAN